MYIFRKICHLCKNKSYGKRRIFYSGTPLTYSDLFIHGSDKHTDIYYAKSGHFGDYTRVIDYYKNWSRHDVFICNKCVHNELKKHNINFTKFVLLFAVAIVLAFVAAFGYYFCNTLAYLGLGYFLCEKNQEWVKFVSLPLLIVGIVGSFLMLFAFFMELSRRRDLIREMAENIERRSKVFPTILSGKPKKLSGRKIAVLKSKAIDVLKSKHV